MRKTLNNKLVSLLVVFILFIGTSSIPIIIGTNRQNDEQTPEYVNEGEEIYDTSCIPSGIVDSSAFDYSNIADFLDNQNMPSFYILDGKNYNLQADLEQWWAQSAGGINYDNGCSIAVDTNRNVYITGYFIGSATFGNTTLISSQGSSDIFVAKLNTVGVWQWAVSGGGISDDYVYDIAVDINGDVYITGQCHASAEGPAIFGSVIVDSERSIFVAKLNTNGVWQWVKTAGIIIQYNADIGYGVAVDSNGDVYITGTFSSHPEESAIFGPFTLVGEVDVFVAKLNTNGVWQWAVSAGGISFDEGHDIAVDTNGNVYITGYFEGTATFGSTTVISYGLGDVFVAKLNTNGVWQWAQRAGGPIEIERFDEGMGVAVDSNGNVYITGAFMSGLDEEPWPAIFGPFTLFSEGVDVFVAKLNTNGVWQWVNKAGGIGYADVGYDIAVDSSGNVSITGYFNPYESATFGNTTLVSHGSSDVFVAKLNTSGVWQWAESAGGSSDDYGNGVAMDIIGNVYITGGFKESAIFGNTTLVSQGGYDVFVAKLSDGIDLYITDMTLIQVVENPKKGIIDKNAVVRINVTNTFYDEVFVNINLTHNFGEIRTEKGPDGAGVPLKPGKNTIYLPGGPVFHRDAGSTTPSWPATGYPWLRWSTAGSDSIEVHVDPDNTIPETNEMNNIMNITKDFVDTKALRIVVVPLFFTHATTVKGFPAGLDQPFAINMGDQETSIQNMFPVADNRFNYHVLSSIGTALIPPDPLQTKYFIPGPGFNTALYKKDFFDWLRTDGLAAHYDKLKQTKEIINIADVVVIVIHNNWKDLLGATFGGKSFISEPKISNLIFVRNVNVLPSTIAHEIGHMYSLWHPHDVGPTVYGCKMFNASQKDYERDARTLMSYKNKLPSSVPKNPVWIDKGRYDSDSKTKFKDLPQYLNYIKKNPHLFQWNLMDQFIQSSSKTTREEAVIVLSGILSDNNTFSPIDPWYSITTGESNIVESDAGDYFIVVKDAAENVLSTYGFNISFDNWFEDDDGNYTSSILNATSFVFSVPHLPGTKFIEIWDNETNVLFSKIISENPPVVQLEYPVGGETFVEGQVVNIQWSGDDADGDDLVYSLSYSTDISDWIPLMFESESTEYLWDTSGFDPSETYYIKLIGTDGVNTGTDQSAAFTLRLSSLEFTITDLGVLGENTDNVSYAYALNNNGQVVGSSGVEYGLQQAFLHDNGVMTGLSVLGDGLWSTAQAINDNGWIAGNSHRQQPNWTVHACLWNETGMFDLGSHMGMDYVSYAYAINNQGQVVGTSYVEPHQWLPPHAFLWTQENGMLDLGILSTDTGSVARAINDQGTVVGSSSYTNENGTQNHAFLWTESTGMLRLETGCANDQAIDVNNQGVIISNAETPNGTHAYLYDNGLVTLLGSLGGSKTFARAINTTGAIVGSSTLSNNTATHAFIYTNGVMKDLNTLIPMDSGWILTEAYDINDQGAIIGYGYNPAGKLRGFLLQPYTLPWVWMTDPMATDFLFESEWEIASITENIVTIRAVDLNLNEITQTLFEYSSDNITWLPLGVDTYGGFTGYIFPEGDNRKIGDEGYSILWDTTPLAEDYYYIRATMTDIYGSQDSCIRQVHIDRNPPKPTIITPTYGAPISGIYPFTFNNNGDNLDALELFMVGQPPSKNKDANESSSWYRQTGLGHAKQRDVGPDYNDSKNRFCGPTAVANALAGLKDNKTYPPGKEGNNTAAAKELVDHLGTCPCHGTNPWKSTGGPNNETAIDNVGDGIKAYLEKRGVGCSNKKGYEVKTYGIKAQKNGSQWNPVAGSNDITFKKYNDEIRRNQSVILFVTKVDAGDDGVVGTADDNITGEGHFLTGEGADTEPLGFGSNDQSINNIDYIDPEDGESNEDLWEDPPDANGFSTLFYNGDFYLVTGMWAVSPKNTTNVSMYSFYKNPEPEHITTVDVDTNQFTDGYHTIITQLTDTEGFIATETITVQIDNTPPTCTIYPPSGLINPLDEILITADDSSGSGIHHIHLDILFEFHPPCIIDVPADSYFFTPASLGVYEGWIHVNAIAFDNASNPSTIVYEEYTLLPNEPPRISITDPAGTAILHDFLWQRRIINESVITLQAFDSLFTGNIQSTTFEYSEDGILWNSIGMDMQGSFDGHILSQGHNKKFGTEGWSTTWDLTGLAQGPYQLKATMDSDLGEHQETIQQIYYDPFPPIPEITYPVAFQCISGDFDIAFTTPALDGISLELLLYDLVPHELHKGPNGWFNQSNLGNAQQGNVGADGDDGENHWCGPTTAANALAGQNDNRLYPPGHNGDTTALAQAIGARANTDRNNGTNIWKDSTTGIQNEGETDFFGSALRQYLLDRNVGCNKTDGYEVTTYGIRVMYNATVNGLYPVTGSNTATFEAYNNELRKGQAVILAIMKVDTGPDGQPYTGDDFLQGGHALTGRGANSNATADGSHTVSYVDPEDGQPDQEIWESHNGFSYLNYNFDYYMITGIWAISKKDTTTSASRVDFDADPSDGLLVSWDSQMVPDGYYTLQTVLTDENNVVGTDTVAVLVDNTQPTSYIEPEGGDIFPTTLISIHAFDECSGVQSIYYQIIHNGVPLDSHIILCSEAEILLTDLGILFGYVEIHYFSTDFAGNSHPMQIALFFVNLGGETTPPITEVIPMGGLTPDTAIEIPASQPLIISAVDELGGSGVNHIHIEIWHYLPLHLLYENDFPGPEVPTFTFQQHGLISGIGMLKFNAVDNAENTEPIHTVYYLIIPGKQLPLQQNIFLQMIKKNPPG